MKALKILLKRQMKRLWGRKVSDIAFGEFVLILQWTCDKYGKVLAKIEQWHPTSKLCHHCGHKNTDLQLKQTHWTCQSCHSHHDRDINAAINILLQAGGTRIMR